MGPEPCSAPSCTKPGARACTGCTTPPPARYCSQECQKRDWKTHTSVCGGRKYNGFMITNTPFEQTTSPPTISDYLTPFYFQRYGHEGEERRELEQRLGWREVAEVGKFYDHEGSDTWYYLCLWAWRRTRSPFGPERDRNLVHRGANLRRCRGGPIWAARLILSAVVLERRIGEDGRVFPDCKPTRGVSSKGMFEVHEVAAYRDCNPARSVFRLPVLITYSTSSPSSRTLNSSEVGTTATTSDVFCFCSSTVSIISQNRVGVLTFPLC